MNVNRWRTFFLFKKKETKQNTVVHSKIVAGISDGCLIGAESQNWISWWGDNTSDDNKRLLTECKRRKCHWPSFPTHPAVLQSFPSPRSENSFHFFSWLLADRRLEPSHHAYGSPTSHAPLCPRASCLPCETNSLFSTSRARSKLWGGGRFVRHYQDNGAIWGTEGTPARLFSTQQTPQHIMCAGGHFRVTVFCITIDDKRESHFIPIWGYYWQDIRGGRDLWLLNNACFGQHTDEGLGRDNGRALCSSNQHHVTGVCSFDLWPHDVWLFLAPSPPPHPPHTRLKTTTNLRGSFGKFLQAPKIEAAMTSSARQNGCIPKKEQRVESCVEHCGSGDGTLQI